MDKALAAHSEGRLDDAVRGYDRVLSRSPRNSDALFMRGTARIQLEQLEAAVDDLRRAVRLRPDFTKALNNLGIALGRLGDAGAAATAFDRALKVDPGYAEAALNQGNAWAAADEADHAQRSFRRALELDPGNVHARIGLGDALMAMGQHPEGMAALRIAASSTDSAADAHVSLGNALRTVGEPVEAERAYRAALDLRPGWPTALNNLGAALHDQGRVKKAAGFYGRAVSAQPGYAEAWTNLGNAQRELGDLQAAEESLRRAVDLRPTNILAWMGLGNVRTDLGASEAAVKAHRHVVKLSPDSAAAQANLAAALARVAEGPGSIEASRRALTLDPSALRPRASLAQALQHVCAWDELEDAMQEPALEQAESPFLSVTLFDDPARNLAAARRRARRIAEHAETLGAQIETTAPGPRQRLRLGYLSADFHGHATAHLMAGLLERHDRQVVEVNAYSYGPDDGSRWRQRIRDGCDGFIDLAGVSTADAAARIAADGVDILVDLKGHTDNARPAILALRPAPVQVAWLGFPGTTGADFIDYALTDAIVTPEGADEHWTEALVRLPGCYQVTDADQRISDDVPDRLGAGLPAQGFVFCSFNQPYKIERRAWDVWMDLLHDTEGSVLWLLSGQAAALDNLRRQAETRGVSADRLVFAPPVAKPAHLARIRLADLGLDTFTVNGHTTTSDTLWAGVPVVSLRGRHFASRVASSVLHAVGLPDLVAASPDDYFELAHNLAQDPAALADMRARLCDRDKASLFDTQAFARKLERAYLAMWDQALAGSRPKIINL